jgi:hypothetical protein
MHPNLQQGQWSYDRHPALRDLNPWIYRPRKRLPGFAPWGEIRLSGDAGFAALNAGTSSP